MGPVVIGISGISGAGKSTLTRDLAEALGATRIHWDDFDELSMSPDNYVEWHRSGKPEGYAAWKYPQLAACIAGLKQYQLVEHPVSGVILEPTEWIIFDAPMGRDHAETGKYIDYWVHLECPLDIALARRLLRDFGGADGTNILAEIDCYLQRSRPLFDEHPSAKPDLVADGTKPITILVAEISAALEAHHESAIPTITDATTADRREIKELIERDWGGEPLVVRAASYYPSQMPGLVCRQGGQLKGFLFYEIRGNALEIIVFEVFDKFRGLGTLLLDHLKSMAARHQLSRIFLMTTNDHLDALRYYQRRGFTLCKLHIDSVRHSRKIKPSIGMSGDYGIPVRDEIDLELML